VLKVKAIKQIYKIEEKGRRPETSVTIGTISLAMKKDRLRYVGHGKHEDCADCIMTKDNATR